MDVEIITPECNVDVETPTWSVLAESEAYSADVVSEVYDIELATGVIVGGVPYVGGYWFEPSEDAQVVPTSMRTMTDDITIAPIPSNYGLITYDGVSITVS